MQFFTIPSVSVYSLFKQLFGQQMVNFQNSIWECLHHHILSKMFFDGILKEHCSQILSCSSFKVGIWLIARPILPTFQLSSPIFFIVLRMWLGLSHSSIVGLPWCACTRPINPMGIHVLHSAHGNECTRTYDIVRNTCNFCFHCARCKFSHGTKTITCASLSHT